MTCSTSHDTKLVRVKERVFDYEKGTRRKTNGKKDGQEVGSNRK